MVGDLRDQMFVAETVSRYKPDIVLHLAADKTRSINHHEAFRTVIETNVIGTLNLIEACLTDPKLKRFIYLGTCEEYGFGRTPFNEQQPEMPISSYSYSKVAVTHLLRTLYRTRGFPIVILRPTLAYGPGQASDMFLPALIEALLRNQSFAMSRGDQTRDYIFVEELVRACMAAMEADVLGKVINIGSGDTVSLRDVALLAARVIGNGSENLLRFGALPYRSNEIMNYSVDITLARELLGWAPRFSLEEGMRRTVESYRNNI